MCDSTKKTVPGTTNYNVYSGFLPYLFREIQPLIIYCNKIDSRAVIFSYVKRNNSNFKYAHVLGHRLAWLINPSAIWLFFFVYFEGKKGISIIYVSLPLERRLQLCMRYWKLRIKMHHHYFCLFVQARCFNEWED
jgi:hypothetical protein